LLNGRAGSLARCAPSSKRFLRWQGARTLWQEA